MSTLSRKLEHLGSLLPEELRWTENEDRGSHASSTIATANDCQSSSDYDSSDDDLGEETSDDDDVYYSFSAGFSKEVAHAELTGVRFVELEVLQAILDAVACCKHCGNGSLTIRETS